MPTLIRTIDLSRPIEAIRAASAYAAVLLIVRWRARVVGRQFVPLRDGALDAADVEAAVRGVVGWDALEAWLHEAVGLDAPVRPGDQPWTSGGAPVEATVAICTRDRPDDLRRALDGLATQVLRASEILVVDNAPSSDATRRLVAGCPGIRYVHEPRPGLDVARNRALREASHDLVAFCDDDAVPEPEWLAALVAGFADPQVAAVTGLTLPLELETPAQEQFEAMGGFWRGVRRRLFDGQHDNPLAVGAVGAGANMALRRAVVLSLGGFDERLDAGTPCRSGGDHELFVRLLLDGQRILYEPAAVSAHRHRRGDAELADTLRGYGTGVYAMWTKLLIEQRQIGVVRLAWSWFRAAHLPLLIAPLRGRRRTPVETLQLAELRGCVAGPLAWWRSARATRRAA